MLPQQLSSGELAREKKLQVARGEIAGAEVPAPQLLNMLVALAADTDAEVSGAARETLQHLSDEQCLPALAALTLPEAVARYFLDPSHARPALLPTLLANPASPQDAITALAAQAGPEAFRALLEAFDLLQPPSLAALKDNPLREQWQKEPPAEGLGLDPDLLKQLVEEAQSKAPPPAAQEQEKDPGAKAAAASADPSKPEGMVSRMAKMTVAQRLKRALLGTKEERTFLIRDGSKVIQRAVLSSPKLGDSEVENFASLKNVSQEVLRQICMNRKFIKNYSVLKNLINNPRLPIDVGLPLLNRLIKTDLRSLSTNRNISETIRKMAEKMFKTKKT
ncbi:MAG: hypothetical protein IH846_03890 [Acidobacteria bacterium]|nr:hypothetical protein [Acidobacteriota bacterium]